MQARIPAPMRAPTRRAVPDSLRANGGRDNELGVAARPVVKWAGGKSRLLDRLMDRMPAGPFDTYAEPFCGGGAMFFALAAQPVRPFRRALLSDKNEELVALYQAIKADVDRLIVLVRRYQEKHFALPVEAQAEHFYAVRKLDTSAMTNPERGARLLFLNKTCFNGLWRVNASGQFNVPFGKYKNPKIFDEEGLRAAHEALAFAEIRCTDYSSVTRELEKGDFAYFDPPYMPVSRTSNFTRYAAEGFGWEQQVELAAELARLGKRGVNAMLSNACTPELEAVYEEHGFRVQKIRAARAINSDPTKRGDVDELVVTNYGEARPASRRGRARASAPPAGASERRGARRRAAV